ncbi:MAG: type I 3-dehydroquinate dehydratase [Chthoniobacterales bacterium]
MRAPKIVGVIFSRADLERAVLMRKPPDLFELRLDRLIKTAIAPLPAPLILTARDPREGGANNLSASRRRALLLEFLPRAKYIDVELRSARALHSVLESASENNVETILSFHDFETTPSVARLDDIASRGRSLGAAVIKVATRTDTPAQLDRLLDFFDHHRQTSDVVAMGIGKLGRTSRLELARRGCILNYAHLGSPVAAGQLSIQDLRRFASRREAVS